MMPKEVSMNIQIGWVHLMNEVWAVDFDGTLCEENFPNIGTPHMGVIEHFKELRKNGDFLILWTCRSGKLLEDALKWCANYGIEFDAVNENLEHRIQKYNNDPRKIGADHYCDDMADDSWKKYL